VSAPHFETAEATMTNTTTRAQDAPPTAFDQATGMEDPLRSIRNFAGALCRIAGTLDGDGDMIVYELALTIQALAPSANLRAQTVLDRMTRAGTGQHPRVFLPATSFKS
jgi:hypothetical protein